MCHKILEEKLSDFVMLRDVAEAGVVSSARSRILADICAAYGSVVQSIASMLMTKYKTTTTSITFDDFVSAGYVGLVEATDAFDIELGVPFSAYARLRIRLSMFEELRRYDDVPRSLRREKAALDYAEESLSRLHQGSVKSEHLADYLQIDCISLEAKRSKLSYSIPWFVANTICGEDGTDMSIFDMLPADNDCELEVLYRQVASVINMYLERCRSLEQRVLELYFFRGLTLREIGQMIGVTKQRVGQIKDQVLIELKQLFLEEMDEATLIDLASMEE
jgi:RNA polymerase sigma factor for flagellar operon FliA